MSDLFWLTDAQMERLKPFFPVSHGVPRVDDKRVLSGIVFVNRNGLRWRDAPAVYGPHKTLYNRWFRWSQKGVFARILLELVRQEAETEMIMIDVEPEVRHGPRTAGEGISRLTAPQPACGKKGAQSADRADKGGSELEAPRRLRQSWAACSDVSERGADQRLHRRSGAVVCDAAGKGLVGGSGL